MKPRLLLLVCVAGLLGCTHEQHEVAADTAQVFLHQERYQAMASRPVALMAPQAFQAKGYFAAEEEPLPLPTEPVTNMVIRTATASIEVDSLEPAIASVRDLASRLGGYVANSGIETGKNRLRQASLEVKVPAARFDEVLTGLTPIGKVESVNVSAQDVGEEFVDVSARMENARRLERRLIDLLANRTGKLKDVLDVEQALARVREQIERHEGRVRYLRAHTATSTLSVTLHEPLPIVASAGRGPIGEAFRQAWRNFVALISFGVQSLGVIIPLAAVGLVGWFVARRWRRVISQRTA